ncbi:MAG TPA: bifunctional 4-hydroxy-2-oxoglutarate aldolase/2-dehydro-3-deoxy-phosphogluconate aldolase [Thermohalobaculum sp.]|nr:bifunctional 4-hydroxy-2-oxoglutarate aldolase/2-dehydro-3-deoxy-phosphogluconate aldolase [Thermohalobaculum sp.]
MTGRGGMGVAELLALAPVVPVLTVEDAEQAVPLAEALVRGGLPALEVTLRTPAALDAIRAMSRVEGAVVGAGTLLTPRDIEAAVAAGARFGVSPGAPPRLLEAARSAGLPFLPGVATPTEALTAAEQGFEILKFFPAEAAGGAAVLKAWVAPLRHLRFCPTGGIGAGNAPDYLALPNVLAVGGSWVAPAGPVAAGDWQRVEDLARSAARLRAASRARD